jgi:hypothetical protein
MEACDCCGRKVDERSLVPVTVKKGTTPYFVCQACDGQYSEQELIERLVEPSTLKEESHEQSQNHS